MTIDYNQLWVFSRASTKVHFGTERGKYMYINMYVCKYFHTVVHFICIFYLNTCTF